MSYIVRYPSDDDDAGRNVGPFPTEQAADAYLRDHPAGECDWPAYVLALEAGVDSSAGEGWIAQMPEADARLVSAALTVLAHKRADEARRLGRAVSAPESCESCAPAAASMRRVADRASALAVRVRARAD